MPFAMNNANATLSLAAFVLTGLVGFQIAAVVNVCVCQSHSSIIVDILLPSCHSIYFLRLKSVHIAHRHIFSQRHLLFITVVIAFFE